MSLAKKLQKGVRIKGLAPLLRGGGVVGNDDGQVSRGVQIGSYTVSGLIWKDITFYANNNGQHPVNILPYEQGAINYADMQGRETISGEFTGCTMAIYTYNGSTRVCHVDTAQDSHGTAPSKATWETVKDDPACNVITEKATNGMISAYLDTVADDKLAGYAGLSVLCVADVSGIHSVYVLREGDDYKVL